MTFTRLRVASCHDFSTLARRWAGCALIGLGSLAWTPLHAQPVPHATEPVVLSRDAQHIYQSSRDKLLQIRTLRRQSNTQSSTGSGFYVAPGVLITNFHVVADLALEPDRHRGVAVSTSGHEQPVRLLGFDVRHDLAVLQLSEPQANPTTTGVLSLRPANTQLQEGERIFSLGNPLDVGFAITEGTYNGLVQRSFYPRIFFGGALNPGMSGGPALDAQGRVIGVNVAKRSDAEQVSFLVPVQFVRELLARTTGQAAAPTASNTASSDNNTSTFTTITQQLLEHQQVLSQRLLAQPAHRESFGPYQVRVPDPTLARCWGDGQSPQDKSLMDFEVSTCSVDADVVVGRATLGTVTVRYESYDGRELSPWQFANRYGMGFGGEPMRLRSNTMRTAAECQEAYVGNAQLPLRAVICLSAYRKYPGLYDLNVLAITLNRPKQGLLMRVDVSGVNLTHARSIAQTWLNGVEVQP